MILDAVKLANLGVCPAEILRSAQLWDAVTSCGNEQIKRPVAQMKRNEHPEIFLEQSDRFDIGKVYLSPRSLYDAAVMSDVA